MWRDGLSRFWVGFWCWLVLSWAWCGDAAAQADAVTPPSLQLSADATDLPLSDRSVYWIDETGAMQQDQVEKSVNELPWRLRRRENQRAPVGALWIMFEAVAPAGKPWFLEVGASVNDRLQLFYRDSAGAWVVQEAGSGVPVALWALPGRLPTFALSTDAGRPVRYLLRVDDAHSDFVAPLSLMREDMLHAHRERDGFVLGGYFGVLALIAFAALSNLVAFRDRASGVLALCVGLLAVGQLGRSGVGGQHLWPEWSAWNDAVLDLWPGAGVAAVLWLVKMLTDPARLSRGLDLAVWALVAALLGATAVHMTVNSSLSLTLVLVLTGVALVAVLSMVMWGWLASQEHYLRLLALAFVPVVVLALFPIARSLALVPASALTRFGLYLGVLLALPILYLAVSTRLMARREAELRASTLSRTDPLTGLPHRQALVDRLDTSLAHARGQKQTFGLLCIRISNLETLGSDFGRDAVDKALVVTASHLRRLSTGYDMSARIGPREFALMLEAPATREAALSRAQQLVASGLRDIPALPGASLRYFVAVALLPRPELDGAATLQWAEVGLDQISPDTRKAIRSLDTATAEQSSLR
jgi:diguanylate cyclase (GGDEF)-like protein